VVQGWHSLRPSPPRSRHNVMLCPQLTSRPLGIFEGAPYAISLLADLTTREFLLCCASRQQGTSAAIAVAPARRLRTGVCHCLAKSR
jgi:hypothetical protein